MMKPPDINAPLKHKIFLIKHKIFLIKHKIFLIKTHPLHEDDLLRVWLVRELYSDTTYWVGPPYGPVYLLNDRLLEHFTDAGLSYLTGRAPVEHQG